MNWTEFNAFAVRTEYRETIEYDLRQFGGARQSEALTFWLDATSRNSDSQEKKIVLKTDLSLSLSASARASLAKLQEQGFQVSVMCER